MNFIGDDIHSIITNLDFSDNDKFKRIMGVVDETVDEKGHEEYQYGREDGYDAGWSDAKKEIEKDIQNPKKTIQELLEAANYDDITLKELFREFKLQMRIKNLL